MSIYQQLKDAGVKLDHYESDLYAEITSVSIGIIQQYEFKGNVDRFRSDTDGKCYYDIPFAYDPYYTEHGHW
jgi:hypothetical protein